MKLSALAEQISNVLLTRARLASTAGLTYGGNRDMYAALGYDRVLTEAMYRARYRRNAVAARVVEAFPEDTWRGGAELIEDQDLTKDTDFELAVAALDQRIDLWNTFELADMVAGLGYYSVILIGAPGALETPLTRAKLEDIAYLQVYASEDAKIDAYDTNEASPRFGLPVFYNLKRATSKINGHQTLNASGKRVHFSRVIHVADGLLDDRVFGTPRLERVWNLIDDLEKVTGGGAEAYWNRANQGMQIDIDPTMDLEDDAVTELENQVDNYRHGLERILRTRGTKINPLGSDVSSFKDPADAIITQISTGTGIPQRVLTGSEQGKQASDQDSVKYYRRVEARRKGFAESVIIRPFFKRLADIKALELPALGYEVSWSQLKTSDDDEKATYAGKLANLNSVMGETVVSPDEIRTRALGWQTKNDAGVKDKPQTENPITGPNKNTPRDPGASGDSGPIARDASRKPVVRHIERDRRGLITAVREEEVAS